MKPQGQIVIEISILLFFF